MHIIAVVLRWQHRGWRLRSPVAGISRSSGGRKQGCKHIWLGLGCGLVGRAVSFLSLALCGVSGPSSALLASAEALVELLSLGGWAVSVI